MKIIEIRVMNVGDGYVSPHAPKEYGEILILDGKTTGDLIQKAERELTSVTEIIHRYIRFCMGYPGVDPTKEKP